MLKVPRVVVCLALAGVAFLVSQTTWAQDLNIENWLRRPGVKLVAVEFYATWCKPCMEAVPRWRALHDKYQSEGLRLLVVSTQDPDGSCSSPGWTPDEVVCDDDGFLAQRFGATQLPAAYLWSWRGQLLAQKTHVHEVEAKIKDWMRTSPRVEIEVGRIASGALIDSTALLNSLRGELKGSDKLVVVATPTERRTLRALVKESLRAHADSTLACKVGAEVTANSLLKASIMGNGRRFRLHLHLFSAELGCLVGSASTRWRRQNRVASIRAGVSKLVEHLSLSSPQYPWSTEARKSPLPQLDPMVGRDFATLEQEMEAAERARRLTALEEHWAIVSKAATIDSLARGVRINALEQFLRIYPNDNPHLQASSNYLTTLRGGQELSSYGSNEVATFISTEKHSGMAYIPAGSFTMGCQARDKQCDDDEKPPHKVALDAFYIDGTEVTVAAYTQCVEQGACKATRIADECNYGKPNKQNHPINCVNWYRAKTYCEAMDKRLPTEAEWEYAARAKDGDLYPWGSLAPTDRLARFDKDWNAGTVAVKSYPKGANGLYDMSGNVWEWVEDCYDSDTYKSRNDNDKVTNNPLHQPDRCPSGRRVLRGGSFLNDARGLRASDRLWNWFVGFRCVLSAQYR